MKKFIIAIIALMVCSPAFADWTKKDRDYFSELLWLPEEEGTIEDKLNMVRFISCLTDYYESKYSFEQVLSRWNSKPVDIEFLKEFIDRNNHCSQMIGNNEDSVNT